MYFLFYFIFKMYFLTNRKCFFSISFPISKCIFFPNQTVFFISFPISKCNFLPKPTIFSISVTILRRGQMPEYGRDFFKRNFSEYVNGFGVDKEGHGLSLSFCLCLCLFLCMSTNLVMVCQALCTLEFAKYQISNTDYWVSLSLFLAPQVL